MSRKRQHQRTLAPGRSGPLTALYRLLALFLDLSLAMLLAQWTAPLWVEQALIFWRSWQGDAAPWVLWWPCTYTIFALLRFVSSLFLGVTPGQWPMGIRQVRGNLLTGSVRSLLSSLGLPLIVFHLPLLAGKRSGAEWLSRTKLQLHHPWVGGVGLLLFTPLFLLPLMAPLLLHPNLWSSQSMGERPLVVLAAPLDFAKLESFPVGPMGMELLLERDSPTLFVLPFRNGEQQACLYLGQVAPVAHGGEWCLRQFTPWQALEELLSLRNMPWPVSEVDQFAAAMQALMKDGESQALAGALRALLKSSVLNTPMLLSQMGLELPVYWQLKRSLFGALDFSTHTLYTQDWGRALVVRAIGDANQGREEWLVFQRGGLFHFSWRSSEHLSEREAGVLETALQGVNWSAPLYSTATSFVPFWDDEDGRRRYYQQWAESFKNKPAELSQAALLALRKIMP